MDQDETQPVSQTTETTQEFFLFEIDSAYYAVPVSEVDQVMKIPPITPVPNAPRAIVGIFHLRSKVVVVLDLVRRMNLQRKNPLTPNFLFIAHSGKNSLALLVDKATTIVHITKSSIAPLDPMVFAHIPERYALGMFLYETATPKKSRSPSIMIEPSGTKHDDAPLTHSIPVVCLNLPKILDQEDLLGIFVAEEGHPPTTP